MRQRGRELIYYSLTTQRMPHTFLHKQFNCISHITHSSVIPHHMLVPFTYGFTCKQCCDFNLRIICSCCFICLYLIGIHMAKQCGIQFTYSMLLFPTSPSDNIQYNRTRYWTGYSFPHSTMFS